MKPFSFFSFFCLFSMWVLLVVPRTTAAGADPPQASSAKSVASAAESRETSRTASATFLYNPLDFPAPRTRSEERKAFLEKLRKETIEGCFTKGLSVETEKSWSHAFWAAELIEDHDLVVRQAILTGLDEWKERSPAFRRALLECVSGLFPDKFDYRLDPLLPRIDDPKLFSMAVSILIGDARDGSKRARYRARLEHQFPKWDDNPILRMLHFRLSHSPDEIERSRPSLVSLLSYPMPGNAPVLFSFQRSDRNYPGLAVIREPDGRFLRRRDGSLFAIPQLAMAMSNLPGTITNGNTPQGIHSIRGIIHTRNVFIGPSPVLHSRLPFEADPADFLHEDHATSPTWSLGRYLALLPADWRSYIPIREAFEAGMAGRNEILIHGTTVNPEFYHEMPCYPLTPTQGCLCALELWSPDGHLEVSNELALASAWRSLPRQDGFLIVVELDSQEAPVTLNDVIQDILAAESAGATNAKTPR